MKRLLMAMIVVAATFAGASPVSALPLCDYHAGTHVLDINMAFNVLIAIERDTGGHIILGGAACDGATVTNTKTIAIHGGQGSQQLLIDLGYGGFKPGYGNESGTSDEIEFTINLGDGMDALSITGTNSVDKIDFGQKIVQFSPVRKINLNAGETSHVDADVTFSGADYLAVSSYGGNDVIRARGLRGTGGDPITLPLQVYGGTGADIIQGGDSPDTLTGDSGPDQVWGYGSADKLYLNDGEVGDLGYGGGATDTCYCDVGDLFVQ